MKYFFRVLVVVVMAVGGTARAESSLPFLEAGHWYTIFASKDEDNEIFTGNRTEAQVKILDISANQWCWIEYDHYDFPANNKEPMVISKKRLWLNFAHVTTVKPGGGPDYQLYKQKYAGGVKIVPFPAQ